MMSMKRFALGAGIGFIAGYFLRPRLEKEFLSPQIAFQMAKENIAKHMPITGSWIHTEREKMKRNHLDYVVYRAGITTKIDDMPQYFDLIIDARTGVILEFQ